MKPKNMPRPISVNAVGKPSMITTTIRPSIERPRAASLMSVASPLGAGAAAALPRRLVDRLGLLDDVTLGLLVDVGAAGELLLDDVDLFRVLQARRPFAGADADDATQDLGEALQHDDGAGERDDELERIERQRRRVERRLAHRVRAVEVVPAGERERADPGQEEDDEED